MSSESEKISDVIYAATNVSACLIKLYAQNKEKPGSANFDELIDLLTVQELALRKLGFFFGGGEEKNERTF